MGSTEEEDFSIPVIDFAGWDKQSTPGKQRAFGKQMVDALATGGFFHLINHGIDLKLLAEVFTQSRRFFGLSLAEKNTVRRPEAGVSLGYTEQGRENPTKAHDVKEAYHVGRAMCDAENEEAARFWPAESLLPGFHKPMTDYWHSMEQLTHPILHAIASGSGFEDPEALTRLFTNGDHVVRTIHYPSYPAADLEGDKSTRLGEHRDFSALTLLFQDDVGGLQVESPKKEGHFVDVTSPPGALIVSVGLPWARWTNDRIKAAKHRVTLPPLLDRIEGEQRLTRERNSIGFFADLPQEGVLETFPQFIDAEHPAKYEPIAWGDFWKEAFQGIYDAQKT